jgi:hypothetical protein
MRRKLSCKGYMELLGRARSSCRPIRTSKLKLQEGEIALAVSSAKRFMLLTLRARLSLDAR